MKVTVNGREVETAPDPCRRLLDFLREDQGLAGTKEGCGKGECGACAVLLDGRLVNSCLVLLGQCEGASVETIEGVAGTALHPVQEAMLQLGAVQCGFCTPGLVMASVALLRENPSPTPAEVRRGIEGNLCRCTGYVKVEAAVLDAARRMREA
ncbi:MAG: (2Fe-2S)-binding protein [Deltaproteobacteria bacterium]|nr:(2Fe-2S)-binding protein [Deltaproteobacteria bacterium]